MNTVALQKKLFKLMGLHAPPQLSRNHQSLTPNELHTLNIAVFHLSDTAVAQRIDACVNEMGACVSPLPQAHTDDTTINALVLDVSNLKQSSDFDALYTATHTALSQLAANGRIVIITDNGETPQTVLSHKHSTHAFEASLIPALEGFMRSLSKEVGHLGATVNLIHIKNGAIDRLPTILRFILSQRSAFISAQTFTLTNHVKDNLPPTYSAPLSGKRVIVTGAARGIGLAIANALAREGAQVIGLDVPNTPSLHEHMKRLNGLALELDITADNATETLCDFLHSNTGAVNGIIHNAGITRDKTIKNMSDSQWQSVLNVNLIAPIKLTQALLDQNMILRGGRIIGLSSISGIAGNAGQTNYALSKGGLAGYMVGLANELASKGITANTIAPGFIETEMTAQIPFMVRTLGRRFNALKQGGLPEDVAELAVFLASANSAGITGHNIRVCGHNLLGK